MAGEAIVARPQGTHHLNDVDAFARNQVLFRSQAHEGLSFKFIERPSFDIFEFLHPRQVVGDVDTRRFVFEQTHQLQPRDLPIIGVSLKGRQRQKPVGFKPRHAFAVFHITHSPRFQKILGTLGVQRLQILPDELLGWFSVGERCGRFFKGLVVGIDFGILGQRNGFGFGKFDQSAGDSPHSGVTETRCFCELVAGLIVQSFQIVGSTRLIAALLELRESQSNLRAERFHLGPDFGSRRISLFITQTF